MICAFDFGRKGGGHSGAVRFVTRHGGKLVERPICRRDVHQVSKLTVSRTFIFKSEETGYTRLWFARLANSARRGAPAVVVTPEERKGVGRRPSSAPLGFAFAGADEGVCPYSGLDWSDSQLLSCRRAFRELRGTAAERFGNVRSFGAPKARASG
jgi:hypothetical protein